MATHEVCTSRVYGAIGLGLQKSGYWRASQDHDGGAYPVAAPLPHLMFKVLHWAVVGFGKGRVGSFQSKKND